MHISLCVHTHIYNEAMPSGKISMPNIGNENLRLLMTSIIGLVRCHHHKFGYPPLNYGKMRSIAIAKFVATQNTS